MVDKQTTMGLWKRRAFRADFRPEASDLGFHSRGGRYTGGLEARQWSRARIIEKCQSCIMSDKQDRADVDRAFRLILSVAASENGEL